MNSPVEIDFHSFITIDRTKSEKVYMQIAYQFIRAVELQIMQEGDLLPGSRKISEALNVHRKTVIAAMRELQEQGWIEIVPNIGTFIKKPRQLSNQSTVKGMPHPPLRASYPFRKELVLDMPPAETKGKYYFTEGTVDEEVIEIAELLRFYSAVLKRKRRLNYLQEVFQGNVFFRDQLSFYLNLSRKLHLSRNALLPISSREKTFSILARLLIQTGDLVLVGELSYFLPNMIFSQAGANLRTIPVDQEGIDVDFIESQFSRSEIRFVYVNSLCHYPTTVKLSDQRKEKLLRLAVKYNFIVIEDDEDFEFSTLKARTDSLFRMEGGNRVIYIGAFGKFLNSSFQMNFLIAPAEVLEEAKKYLNVFGKSDFMLEKALGEMIQQGDIFRYQRKSQKIINTRKKVFSQLLVAYFQDQISFQIPESGLAFWIVFNEQLSLIQLQAKALANGLLIPKTCLFQNRTLTALRLGFAHLEPQDMEAALAILHQSYKEVLDQEN